MKKYLLFWGIFLYLPLVVLAANWKYTFNDVVLADGTIIEIEAAVKDTKITDLTRCDYFSDNYLEWLGYYQELVAVGPDFQTVSDFCLSFYTEKVQQELKSCLFMGNPRFYTRVFLL